MEVTQAQLAAHFAAMEDHALQAAAAARNDLSSLARDVLSAELRTRGLQLAPIDDPSTEEDLPSTQVWVTVDRFRDLSMAIVARSALEAADIPCFLRDENTVRMDWQISNFIGGMRLQVLEEDREVALEVLGGLAIDDLPEATDKDVIPGEACPNCGSADIHRDAKHRGLALAALYFLSLPVARGKLEWHCDACGTRWDDSATP